MNPYSPEKCLLKKRPKFQLALNANKSISTEHNKSELSWDGCDDNGRQLPDGIYFIELKSGNQSKTEKVIKLR